MKNWMRRITADGVIFYAPEGADVASVRVRERVYPLKRLRDIRAEQLAALSDLKDVKASEVKRLVTAEGEDAFTYSFSAHDGDAFAQVGMGIVFGPDFYASADSLCGQSSMAESVLHAVEHITRTMPLGLGQARTRRYEYTPPAGWQPIVKTHSVSWYPPDFPKHRAVIRVVDAVPSRVTKSIVMARRMFDDPQNDLATVTDVTAFELATDKLMTGVYEVTRGTWGDGVPAVIIRATLSEAAYTYNLRLEACEPFVDSARELFDQAVRSVVEVTRPPVEPNVGRMIYWSEE